MSEESRNDRVSMRVVEAVSAANGVEPVELSPLYDTVDPDALDNLFRENGRAIESVKFTYEDTLVEVTEDGVVTVGSTDDEVR